MDIKWYLNGCQAQDKSKCPKKVKESERKASKCIEYSQSNIWIKKRMDTSLQDESKYLKSEIK